VMAKADLAITYFGITAYELAKMGVPTMVIAHSKEDEINTERFSRYGTCMSIGYFKHIGKKKIYLSVKNFIKDKKLRDKMSIEAKQLFDGKGAERIAQIVYLQ